VLVNDGSLESAQSQLQVHSDTVSAVSDTEAPFTGDRDLEYGVNGGDGN
jgi:hypothetical protein